MAPVEQWIFGRLTTFAGLAAKIGTRCYENVLPERVAYPAIRYQRIDTPQTSITHDGGPAGLANPRFQFDVFAETGTEAGQTAEQLRLCLEGYQDKSADPRIDAVLPAGRRGGREPNTNLHRVSMDFIIWHAEATS